MLNFQKSQIPERFWMAETTLPLASYFIFGPVGVGKTYLAAGLAINALKDGMRSVAFRSTFSLFAQLRAHNPRDYDDYSRVIIENAKLLVIDDLGKESMTAWKFEQLFGLINHRYEHQLLTVMTSNFSLSELGEAFASSANSLSSEVNAQAIVSRIYELCEPKELTGIDRRTQ
jgi:DNA replication protein DnaC